ncbi:head-tail connector protein [Bordetella genomosp. 9]|uniref:DNA packaging protein n=1 Tax=Bordetella genomosp. 9 TaxID=1416803 RepID=A0A1W6YXI5_9BORD|nr:head-tail connector protein [Bordetella genomosp. 9]ARP85768.1 DNA packaging protein [Bordetella genomosp. 9]
MVTLEEAKLHIRFSGDDADDELQRMIDAATDAAADYLNMARTDLEKAMPAPVHAAILLQVGDLFANRERQSEEAYYQNRTYERLLNPYRVMIM